MASRANGELANLVAVVGTTGVGKSQLAVELALSVSELAKEEGWKGPQASEVINSDSMQVYKGLDVITNKATKEEMKGVPHHLMEFLDPDQEYKVGDFQRDAVAKIDELGEQEKLPIVVGGTAYYLQHLVFPNTLVSDVPAENEPVAAPAAPKTLEDIANFPPDLKASIEALPTELLQLFLLLPSLPRTSSPDSFPLEFPISSLPSQFQEPLEFSSAVYKILNLLDEDSARRWHWRDVRKTRRAIEILWEGRRWQDVLDAQKERKQVDQEARFRTLIFWLYAENDQLFPRLDSRVDKMLDLGLMDEIEELWSKASERDYTRGIYQAIGYKEFSPYLTLKSTEPESPQVEKLFKDGLERMKISTRSYAKRQVKWIKQRLLPAIRALEDRDVEIVLLDATELVQWKENVQDPAVAILKQFLQNEELPDAASLSSIAARELAPPSSDPSPVESRAKKACLVCSKDPSQPFMIEERQWEAHVKSRSHRKAVQKRDDPEPWKRRLDTLEL